MSNNEVFAEKLKSYANTLYWNETLRADCYKSKLDFAEFTKQRELTFQPCAKFGPDELEARHKLLFKMTSMIWSALGREVQRTPIFGKPHSDDRHLNR